MNIVAGAIGMIIGIFVDAARPRDKVSWVCLLCFTR